MPFSEPEQLPEGTEFAFRMIRRTRRSGGWRWGRQIRAVGILLFSPMSLPDPGIQVELLGVTGAAVQDDTHHVRRGSR